MSNWPSYPPMPGSGMPGAYPPGPPQPYYPPAPGAYPGQQQSPYPGYPPQPAYAPPQQGYPPQQQGYPPPQQGYPPQGFPPQQQQGYAPPYQQQAYAPPPQQQGYPAAYPGLPAHNATAPTGMAHQQIHVHQNVADEPTVRPFSGFSAENDSKALKKAMAGLGTDEKAIIDILANRSLGQRLEIVKVYKTMYGKDLLTALKSELSGNFEDVVVALLQPPEVFDAHSLHDAVCGVGTKEDTLIEIICSRSNQELAAIKAAYKFLYKKELEKDIAGDTSGYFKRIMIACLQGNRTEGCVADVAQAKVDADALYKAGPKKLGTDESTFISIFALRSYAQLAVIFEEFKRLANQDIEKVIASEMSGNLEASFKALAKFVKNKHAFFAENLYNSMKGAGTHDRVLIRLVVTRCEKDLENVKREFQRMYGKTLSSFIASDCSGDYKKMLLALVK